MGSIAAWDFDVPEECYAIPLEPGIDARRWASALAKEAAADLGGSGDLALLTDALAELQPRLVAQQNPWLTAIVAIRPEEPMSVGALITAQQLILDPGDTIESIETFMRAEVAHMSPGHRSRELHTWRTDVPVGTVVGLTQRVESIDPGEEEGVLSERAVLVVFPTGSTDVVQFSMTAEDFNYFRDIRAYAERLAGSLRVQLEESA